MSFTIFRKDRDPQGLISHVLIHIFAATILAAFTLSAIALVASRGVCCADDSAFASIAKNLAWGYGYASSISYDSAAYQITLFDPTMQTTGPAVILPVAALIALLGNQYWVPGAAFIILWIVLLLTTYKVLCKFAPSPRISVAGGVFLLLVHALSPWHFEQWWALLGEVPAALLPTLGFAVWAAKPESKGNLIAGSVITGLAITAKVLALLYAGALIFAMLLWRLSDGSTNRCARALSDSGWAAVCCLLPQMSFEAWKLVTLGINGYILNVQRFSDYFHHMAVQSDLAFFAKLSERMDLFQMHFGVPLWVMLLTSVLSVLLSFNVHDARVKRLTTTICLAVLGHVTYWVFFSIGWPRYIYSAVVLMCFGTAIPVLILTSRKDKIIYSVLMLTVFSITNQRINYPLPWNFHQWFSPSPERLSQAAALQFLEARMNRRPFVAQRGASIATILNR